MCFRPAAAATPKVCPVCGQINAVVATTCLKCKAPLPEDRIACPHCGEMNDADSTACAECGFDLSAGGTPPTITPPSTPSAGAPAASTAPKAPTIP